MQVTHLTDEVLQVIHALTAAVSVLAHALQAAPHIVAAIVVHLQDIPLPPAT